MRWLIVLVIAMQSAQAADSATCYTLSSADARAFCLARAHGDPSRCYSIQSTEMRATCLAEVRM